MNYACKVTRKLKTLLILSSSESMGNARAIYFAQTLDSILLFGKPKPRFWTLDSTQPLSKKIFVIWINELMQMDLPIAIPKAWISSDYWRAYGEKKQITKATITKIWHIFIAKSRAAIEKSVSVLRFACQLLLLLHTLYMSLMSLIEKHVFWNEPVKMGMQINCKPKYYIWLGLFLNSGETKKCCVNVKQHYQ